MIKIDGRYVLLGYYELATLRQFLMNVHPNRDTLLNDEEVKGVTQLTKVLRQFCVDSGMVAAVEILDGLFSFLDSCPRKPMQSGDAGILIEPDALRGLSHTFDRFFILIDASIRNLLLLSVDAENKKYWDEETKLSEEAEARFTDAIPEISESSKCIALERDTASVFHSMRALEVALDWLCAKFNIQPKNPNWENVLNDITGMINKMDASTAGPNWKQDQQRYSAAVAHLRVCKNAWRNYAMHRHSTYGSRDAKDIFASVKAFLSDLSKP